MTRVRGGMAEGKRNSKRRMRRAPAPRGGAIARKRASGEEHPIICMDGLKREAYPSN